MADAWQDGERAGQNDFEVHRARSAWRLCELG